MIVDPTNPAKRVPAMDQFENSHECSTSRIFDGNPDQARALATFEEDPTKERDYNYDIEFSLNSLARRRFSLESIFSLMNVATKRSWFRIRSSR